MSLFYFIFRPKRNIATDTEAVSFHSVQYCQETLLPHVLKRNTTNPPMGSQFLRRSPAGWSWLRNTRIVTEGFH